MERVTTDKKKRALLLISIFSNFGLLFYFKYFSFFIENLNLIWVSVFNNELKFTSEILPIGLSFHTFQSVSYVIDVYKGKIKAEKHLGIYSSYVLFFPQMVAGPIERYSTLGRELNKISKFDISLIKNATPLILTGLFYKMVIADNCGDYVNNVYSNTVNQNSLSVLAAILLFCLQIYCDFFGYSLIAQGSATLFNIQLVDNFQFPFFSNNLVEFWKKWHMSLTGWFRDYVYIPLGGNRVGNGKHILNIIAVFSLSGLWHGAGLNFIIWGVIHALVYLITQITLKNHPLKFTPYLNYFFTFFIVALIFVFFRNGKLNETLGIYHELLAFNSSKPFQNISLLLILNIAFMFGLEKFALKYHNYANFFQNQKSNVVTIILSYLLFTILTYSGVDNLPFIYFQF